jgi:uncharacterized membrane protein YqhA
MIALLSKVKSFAIKGAQGIENTFEWCLWKTRLFVHVAVAASLATAFGLFLITAVDVVRISASFLDYSNLALSGDHTLSAEQQQKLDDKRADIQADTVELIDNCLLATIMVIFAFGLYELFISKIEVAERSGLARNLLLIRSFDDLKERLGKVVLLMLVVKFFEYALVSPIADYTDATRLAGCIALLSLALYLSHRAGGHHVHQEHKHPATNVDGLGNGERDKALSHRLDNAGHL